MNTTMNPPVIDFHTHPYLTPEENTCFYRDMFPEGPEAFRQDLASAGITRFCGTVIAFDAWTEASGFDHFRMLNDHALQLREIHGDAYVPGFHVHPAHVAESCAEIVRMHEAGVRLVGELVPYMHGWSDYSCSAFGEILEVAGQYGMAVSFHTLDDDQMTRMALAHPDVTFVAAHPGERERVQAHIDRMMRCDNVYLDLSGTGLIRYGMVAHVVRKVGADRILFGTDFPICNPRMYVQAVLHEPISTGDCEKILSGNAKRVLRLES